MTFGRNIIPSEWLIVILTWQYLILVSAAGSIIDRGPVSSSPVSKELFIVDTDAGSDDAVAIVMAASKLARREKGLEVIAITCANGNTHLDNVVVNVLKTLKTINRLDIPVFRGSSKSILRTPETDNFFGFDGFGDFKFEGAPDPRALLQREHAVSALIRFVNANPGKINLLAIGPLTNIALAARLQPDFLQKVKRIFVLGGAANGVGNIKPGVEFNFYMDPHAAEIVLNETARPVCLVPWETARIRSKIFMDWRKNVLGALDTPSAKLLNLAERVFTKDDSSQWISSDSYAAWMALNYNLNKIPGSTCGGFPLYGSVLTGTGDEGGALMVDYANNTGKPANFELIEEINVQAFKDTLFKIVSEE